MSVDDASPDPVPEPLPLVPVPEELVRALNPFGLHVRAQFDPTETFRVGELSRRSGIAVGTIKFYLREGLLPPGEATAKTQALYNGEHVRRLRVIRVLSEVGGLSIAQIRQVVDVLEDDDIERGGVSQAVGYAVAAAGTTSFSRRSASIGDEPDVALDAARTSADEFLAAIGIVADDHHPARAQFAEAYAALLALGVSAQPIIFTEHARLAYELARFEVGAMDFGLDGRDASAERQTVDQQVVGTVVFGAAFMALRSLAHEHEVRRLLAGADSPPPPTPPAPAAPRRGSP